METMETEGHIYDRIVVPLAEDHRWVCEIRRGKGEGVYISESRHEFDNPDGAEEIHDTGITIGYSYADAVEGANRLIAHAPDIIHAFLGGRRFAQPDVISPSIADELFG